MKYYKIFSLEHKKFWRQDKYGYTNETDAGWWADNEIPFEALRDCQGQKLVEFEPSRLMLFLKKVREEKEEKNR